jgi:hypothetical protein
LAHLIPSVISRLASRPLMCSLTGIAGDKSPLYSPSLHLILTHSPSEDPFKHSQMPVQDLSTKALPLRFKVEVTDNRGCKHKSDIEESNSNDNPLTRLQLHFAWRRTSHKSYHETNLEMAPRFLIQGRSSMHCTAQYNQANWIHPRYFVLQEGRSTCWWLCS